MSLITVSQIVDILEFGWREKELHGWGGTFLIGRVASKVWDQVVIILLLNRTTCWFLQIAAVGCLRKTLTRRKEFEVAKTVRRPFVCFEEERFHELEGTKFKLTRVL